MVSLDSDKIKIQRALEYHKDEVNELIKRFDLINSNSAKSWEINAAREFVNTELFPSIKSAQTLLNDLVWNYEYDPTSFPSFKDYEIKQVKRELEQINELLCKHGICFVYKPPLVK